MREDMAAFEDDDNGENHGSQEIIDEEELSLLQKMKELKKVYRTNFDSLKEAKAQVHYIQQSIDTLKQSLVSAFEEWFLQTFLDPADDFQSTLVTIFYLIFLATNHSEDNLPIPGQQAENSVGEFLTSQSSRYG